MPGVAPQAPQGGEAGSDKGPGWRPENPPVSPAAGQHPRYRALRPFSANPSSFCSSPETHRRPNARTAHGLITVLHFARRRNKRPRDGRGSTKRPSLRCERQTTDTVHPAYASNCLLIGEHPVTGFSKHSSSPMTSVTSHENEAWPQAILPDPLRGRGPPC